MQKLNNIRQVKTVVKLSPDGSWDRSFLQEHVIGGCFSLFMESRIPCPSRFNPQGEIPGVTK